MKNQSPFYLRPMFARDSHEPHRAATPLELFFDLVSVIAIAAAAAGLHHGIAEAHLLEGVLKFSAIFFAIWWAWMNYTWFASAYDNDDTVFRITTFVIMAGALVMASGVSAFFDSMDMRLVVAGFVLMRLGMVAMWLRAYRHDTQRRKTAIRYAVGITLAQVFWVGILVLQPLTAAAFFALFVAGIVLELVVPVFAERTGMTPWHRHHMIERYGLLNIIVLGETLLAGSMALSSAAADFDPALVQVALSGLAIVFSLWWLYFSREEHLKEQSVAMAFIWGYGHLVIYMSGAAVGAGFAALVDIVTGHSAVSLLLGSYAVAVPVALYLAGLWFVRDRFVLSGAARMVLPAFALLIVLAPLLSGIGGVAVLSLLCVGVRSQVACRKM